MAQATKDPWMDALLNLSQLHDESQASSCLVALVIKGILKDPIPRAVRHCLAICVNLAPTASPCHPGRGGEG